MMRNDRRTNVKEIAEAINISEVRVCHILNQDLGMKVSASWVSRLLTFDQTRVRINISNALLAQ